MLRNTTALLTKACFCLLIAQFATAQERIVSTDAAVTQVLFALGADAQLVGVDTTSELPEGYRILPEVGYHRALSAEGLLSLDPTLVIGSEQIGPPTVLKALGSAGIPLLQLRPALTIDELQWNIAEIAKRTNSTAAASILQTRIAQQAKHLESLKFPNTRMVFVLSVEPGKLRIAGTGTTADAFIKLLGGTNIADFDAYRTLSSEALLALDPAVMLVAGHEGNSPAKVLELNPILQYVSAARIHQLYEVNAANLVAGLAPGAVIEAAFLAARIGEQVDGS